MYGLRSSRRTRGYIDPGPEPADLEEESSGDEMNVDPPLQEDDQPSTEEDPLKDTALNRMVIAIDFGTTFSAVAYTILPRNVQPDEIGLDRVNCIGNYPGYQAPSRIFGQRQDVPTELWYDYGQVEALRTTQHSIISNNEDESSSDDDSEAGENDVEHSEHEKIEIARGKKVIRQTHQPITQYWGYNVQEKLSKMNIPRENARPLTRFKLCLAEDIQTESVRTGVKKTLNVLKRRKIITQDTDIYLHYLTHLLRHTKQQLGQIIQKDTAIQFVLCVPAKWPTNACRIMQTALERAVMDVGFGEGAERSVHNIFIISEPEAAAQCILTEENSDIRVIMSR